jgi:hypothetical protein
VKEAPDRAEYRREKFEAVCYLGEEAIEDFILCEEVDIDCIKGGLCGENRKWWNFAWKAKIVLTRQGLVADRAWEDSCALVFYPPHHKPRPSRISDTAVVQVNKARASRVRTHPGADTFGCARSHQDCKSVYS